ncbi:MAG: cell division protein FtsQ [Bacteroidales bacterium]|nr:cell division protein FtsQ [Bacteroidales bacterium]MCM1146900.1 cell division protein FtsQ [Bacteroidales bacterium]MCM1205602.1 cell division protein FtsQ [Bacillota bacterium]MCM1510287.1 hypothetical protein [Clostridium sp.]
MKKYIIILIDIMLAVYLLLAITAFNSPKELAKKCTKVNINITDETTYGFLNADEIKSILIKKGIYPLEKDLDKVSPRKIESVLRNSPFVNTAECCKTTDGHVLIYVTQRSPLVRIKSENGDDYYIDENGGIMPNSKYTSDLIIVTGNVSKPFARQYVSILANTIMKSDFWRNQVEQINVDQNLGIEVVPRVGDHIIFLGYLPEAPTLQKRNDEVTAYVSEKLDRLEKFYIYGLKETGWNKYETIDVQFRNQIICKKHPVKPAIQVASAPEPAEAVPTPSVTDNAASQDGNQEQKKKQE